MTAFLALIRKDLLVFFQDRRAVLMTFVAPILIGSFFGYVFGGTSRSGEPGKITSPGSRSGKGRGRQRSDRQAERGKIIVWYSLPPWTKPAAWFRKGKAPSQSSFPIISAGPHHAPSSTRRKAESSLIFQTLRTRLKPAWSREC